MSSFENGKFEEEKLQIFCKNYIELAERIILYSTDEIEQINELEKEIVRRLTLGEEIPMYMGFTPAKARMHFMNERIKVIQKVYDERPERVNDILEEIRTLFNNNSVEVDILKLTKGKKRLLSSIELYANYYVVEKRSFLLEKSYNYNKNK